MKRHHYEVRVEWTGNKGHGTETYTAYSRDHAISAAGKPVVPGSSDPAFRGDPARYNPEELLVSALSSCHMLFYLHLCAVNHVTVVAYEDMASGAMEERKDGSGAFTRVLLKPVVTIREGDREKATALHQEAHHYCFIANSVNFPVEIEPTVMEQVIQQQEG